MLAAVPEGATEYKQYPLGPIHKMQRRVRNVDGKSNY